MSLRENRPKKHKWKLCWISHKSLDQVQKIGIPGEMHI